MALLKSQEIKKVLEWAKSESKLKHYVFESGLMLIGNNKSFPDLFVPVPIGYVNGMFILVKQENASSVSDTQKAWLSYLKRQGYHAIACYGHLDAINKIKLYLGD